MDINRHGDYRGDDASAFAHGSGLGPCQLARLRRASCEGDEARRETEEWIRSITPLHGQDIANAIVYAVTQPQYVDINEMLIRPSQQAR